MDGTRTLRPAPEVLAEIAALLDGVDPCSEMLADAARLDLVASARRLAGRLQALASTLAASASQSQAAERQVGVPLASWLAASQRMTRREAHRLIGVGHQLAPFPDLNRAALAGAVGFEQASAIATVLALLPDDFSAAQVAEAEATMLGYASEFDSSGLARLSRRLVEVLDPVGADERDARRLERDLKQAEAARHLTFLPDGHGSVLIRGSLPTLDAEPLVKLVDAYAQADRRAALDRLDPLVELVSPAMRRADALCALVAAHQQRSLAPSCGGDRPRVVVTLDFDRLRARCIAAGLLGSGESITAGELRRLACDAEILPAVLGGASEVLDAGRSQRLVTPAIRLALDLRDGGCVFPGCDAPPSRCEAHHVVPWLLGGSTALGNLVLLCHIHHPVVEPAVNGIRDQWTVRIAEDGLPEFTPPIRLDAARRPVRHTRHSHPRGGTGQPRPPNAA